MNIVQFRKYSKLPKWAQFEEEVAEYMEGRRTKGSGSSIMDKGDINCEEYLIECKFTEKDAYSLNVKTWEKIVEEAINLGKIPLFACRCNKGDFFICDGLDYDLEEYPEEIIERKKTFNVDRECQLIMTGERKSHNLVCWEVDLDI